nr:hypothetical protein Iba_chr02aCG18260 [Ipomoea batatas]
MCNIRRGAPAATRDRSLSGDVHPPAIANLSDWLRWAQLSSPDPASSIIIVPLPTSCTLSWASLANGDKLAGEKSLLFLPVIYSVVHRRESQCIFAQQHSLSRECYGEVRKWRQRGSQTGPINVSTAKLIAPEKARTRGLQPAAYDYQLCGGKRISTSPHAYGSAAKPVPHSSNRAEDFGSSSASHGFYSFGVIRTIDGLSKAPTELMGNMSAIHVRLQNEVKR